jgi:hypothetical protein
MTEAYSSLDCTRELYETKSLSRMKKEEITHQIKPNPAKVCNQYVGKNKACNLAVHQDL